MGSERHDPLGFIVGKPCGLVDGDAAYELMEDAHRLGVELPQIVESGKEVVSERGPQAGTERRPERKALPNQLGLVRELPVETWEKGGARPFRSASEEPRRADCGKGASLPSQGTGAASLLEPDPERFRVAVFRSCAGPVEEFVGEAADRDVQRRLHAIHRRLAVCPLSGYTERTVPESPIEHVGRGTLQIREEVQDQRHGMEVLGDHVVGSGQDQLQEWEYPMICPAAAR